ncbi:putative centrosomal protein [Cryptosporidium felis]|nr:putative centrosomal protein [Cryptosporidium felis]
MRAAWGALKGAVQELNDALLEVEDDEIEENKGKIFDDYKKNQEARNYSEIHNLNLTNNKGKSTINKRNDHEKNKNFRKNTITSYSNDLVGMQDNEISDNKKLEKYKNSKNLSKRTEMFPQKESLTSSDNIIMLQDSENSDESNPENDEFFDWGLETKERNSLNEYSEIKNSQVTDSNGTSKVIFGKQSKEDGGENKVLDILSSDDKIQNNIASGSEEENFEYNNNSQHSANTIGLSARSPIDGTESIGTDTFEYEDYNNDYSEENDELAYSNMDQYLNDEDLGESTLPSVYIEELSEIFHMEIKNIEYLLKVIQGYHSDWKGIRDSLIGEKELIISLAPKHYESYLANTVLDAAKPFSLGFTVLIGQCIESFIKEIKKKDDEIALLQDNIVEFEIKNSKQLKLTESLELRNTELNRLIPTLEEKLAFLEGENADLRLNIENERRESDKIDRKRVEDLENERNNLIVQLEKMTSEKGELQMEIERLHDHINNLTSIIEGYQTEEEQINSRYEIELERARFQERKLLSKLSALDSCYEEINLLKQNISELEEEKNSLLKQMNDLQENNKNLLDSNEAILKQLNDLKEEQKNHLIDKRFIIQVIQKHNEDKSRIKYRDDLFNLLCDVIGIQEDERSLLFGEKRSDIGNTREQAIENINEGIGFADLFYNFLNSEVEGKK